MFDTVVVLKFFMVNCRVWYECQRTGGERARRAAKEGASIISTAPSKARPGFRHKTMLFKQCPGINPDNKLDYPSHEIELNHGTYNALEWN